MIPMCEYGLFATAIIQSIVFFPPSCDYTMKINMIVGNKYGMRLSINFD